MNTQKCSKCHIEKIINDFHSDRSHPSGRAYICKQCERKRKLDWKYKKKKYNIRSRYEQEIYDILQERGPLNNIEIRPFVRLSSKTKVCTKTRNLFNRGRIEPIDEMTKKYHGRWAVINKSKETNESVQIKNDTDSIQTKTQEVISFIKDLDKQVNAKNDELLKLKHEKKTIGQITEYDIEKIKEIAQNKFNITHKQYTGKTLIELFELAGERHIFLKNERDDYFQQLDDCRKKLANEKESFRPYRL